MAKFEITWLEDKSDEAVLEEIRRVAALEPGRRLTVNRFDSLARIKSGAVWKRFGSFGEATRRAGLAHTLPDYSDAAIIEDLKRVSESFPNEPLTEAFYTTQGRYSRSCVKRRFGGWREALDTAGIGNRYGGPPTTERMKSQPGRAMSNEEILVQIRDVSARLGKASLSSADIVENSEITQSQLFRRFDSASAAFKQAGVEQVGHGRRYTEDEVFENLLKVWTHYGRTPTVVEMDQPPSTVGKNTYIKRYGGWRKALKAFIERSNSEVDSGSTLDPGQERSTLAERNGQTESSTASAVGTERAQPASQTTTRARLRRRTPTNVKPREDRREPSIGLRLKVLQRDRFRCQLCGQSPSTDLGCKLHVDHIVAFSNGGKTTFENLQALCLSCKVGKSNRSI